MKNSTPKHRPVDPRRIRQLIKLVFEDNPEAQAQCDRLLLRVLKKAFRRNDTNVEEKIAIVVFCTDFSRRPVKDVGPKHKLWRLLRENDEKLCRLLIQIDESTSGLN